MAVEAVQPIGPTSADAMVRPSAGDSRPGGGTGGTVTPLVERGEDAAIRTLVEEAFRKLHLVPDETVRLSFTLHEGSDRMMVRVIDVETGEVVREIPPAEILDTVARIMEFVGLLLDRRA